MHHRVDLAASAGIGQLPVYSHGRMQDFPQYLNNYVKLAEQETTI